jgi:thiol-disulfide isomerase/thioredoxin
MNWSNRSARPRPARTLLLVVLALLAGSFVGTFFIDGGSAEPVPSTQTPAGVTAEGAGAGILPTPVTLANASSSAPRTAENTALPGVATPAVHSVTLGAVAPDFTLPDLFDVETTYTLSTYQGQPVILNFWASWCVPCRREMPALQQTAARYKADGLVLLGMNQTYLDTLSEARAFVEELGLTFPTTRDDDGDIGARAYQVVGIPTTVFITQEGDVAHIQIGEMSLEQITAYTEQLMAGQPIQP